MNFEKGHLYHVYNQGNNRQKIFFQRKNYAFFIQKIKTHLLPHADVVAWCLMPNHFHLMVYVHSLEIEVDANGVVCGCTDGVTLSHPVSGNEASHPVSGNEASHPVSGNEASHPVSNNKKKRKINDSIAILLRSYTRAVNIQENRSGNLFREATKAQCLNKSEDITPAYLNTSFGTLITMHTPEKEYPKICFNYIHQNPVKANMVKNAKDWEFSSYSVYCGLKEDDGLVNINRAKEFLDIPMG